ncbi:MAG: hypothetical protein LBQ98_03455 [Nitrososphaerota archaeon]|jgi:hypothetical protein|nr:hypothetical protein [Nitrososphaerota archaeon]
MVERTPEKKGHLRITVDLEVNDELMDTFKETVSRVSTRLPELMRRGGAEKTHIKETC